jgi:hypothetical protein
MPSRISWDGGAGDAWIHGDGGEEDGHECFGVMWLNERGSAAIAVVADNKMSAVRATDFIVS